MMKRLLQIISACFVVSAMVLTGCEQSQKSTTGHQEILSPEGYFMGGDSLKLFYTVVGEGEDTLVVIHGGPGMDAGYMVNDFGPLAENHVLLFYDQRGGGRSELPDTSKVRELLSIERHVEDLEALKKYFKFSELNLVAHSFGPAIAINYALKYPDNIGKMVFIGPIPPYKGDFFERYAENLSNRLTNEELILMDSLGREIVIGEDPKKACAEYWKIGLIPRISSELDISIVKGDFTAAPVEGIRYGYQYTGDVTFSSLGNWDYRSQIESLQVPVLVIHGTEEAIPMDMVEVWTEHLPQSRLIKVEKAGHFPYAERPEQVWDKMEGFFRVGLDWFAD